MNLLNGTHATTAATQFPTDFSWNMCNGAKNQGSEAYHGWEVAKHIGIPTVQSYGAVHGKKIGPWPNGYQIWREAMEYRVAGYRYTPAVTVPQIHEARGWLFDRNQNGKFVRESVVEVPDGSFGQTPLILETILRTAETAVLCPFNAIR